MVSILDLFKRKRPGEGNDLEAVMTAEKQPNFLSQFLPEDEEKRNAVARALIMGGAHTMAAGGPSSKPTNLMAALGAGLAGGVEGYDAARTADMEAAKVGLANRAATAKAQEAADAQSFAASMGGSGNGAYSIEDLKRLHAQYLAMGEYSAANSILERIQRLDDERRRDGMVLGEDGYQLAPGVGEGLLNTERLKAAGRVSGEEAYKKTDDIREFEYGAENTEFRSEQERLKKAGATNVTVEGNKFGTIPAGFQLVEENGKTRLEAIPGSPQAEEQRLAAEKRGLASGHKQVGSDVVVSTIDDIFRLDRGTWAPTTGLSGSFLSNLPGTAAHDINQSLSTLQANAAFERLGAMRAASPTGGALGAVSDAEMRLLQNSYSAMSQSQSPDQFKLNLNRFHNTYMDIVHGPEAGSKLHRSLDYDGSEEAQQTAKSAPVIVSSEEQLNSLPKGTLFRFDDEERVRVK